MPPWFTTAGPKQDRLAVVGGERALSACLPACLRTHSLNPPVGNTLNHRFVLFRDDGLAGNLLEMAAVAAVARGGGGDSNGGGSGVSPTRASITLSATPASAARTTVASYKGRANGCEVAGLSPNTLYHFRVRTVNTRTRSSLSPPLEVCVQAGYKDAHTIKEMENRNSQLYYWTGN